MFITADAKTEIHRRRRSDRETGREIRSKKNTRTKHTTHVSIHLFITSFPRRTETIIIILPCYSSNGHGLRAHSRDRTFIKHTPGVRQQRCYCDIIFLHVSVGRIFPARKTGGRRRIIIIPVINPLERPKKRASRKNHECATDTDAHTGTRTARVTATARRRRSRFTTQDHSRRTHAHAPVDLLESVAFLTRHRRRHRRHGRRAFHSAPSLSRDRVLSPPQRRGRIAAPTEYTKRTQARVSRWRRKCTANWFVRIFAWAATGRPTQTRNRPS